MTLFTSIVRKQNKLPVRCFTFLMTIHFFFVLSVLSSVPARADQGDEEEKRRTQPTRILSGSDHDYTFTPGSAIQVTIWQEPDLSGNFSIDSQGFVILPLIGMVNVTRFSPESLESYLEQEYSSYLRNPIIQTLPLIRVSVLGNVRYPGLYRVEPDRPIWDVIAMAGGPTERGDVTRMYVSRGGEVINENLLVAYEEGVSLREIGIDSGDQVVVPHYKGPFPWRMIISLASLGVSIWALSTRN